MKRCKHYFKPLNVILLVMLFVVGSVTTFAQEDTTTTRINLEKLKVVPTPTPKKDIGKTLPKPVPVKVVPTTSPDTSDQLTRQRQAALMALEAEREEAARLARQESKEQFAVEISNLLKKFEDEKQKLAEENQKVVEERNQAIKKLEGENSLLNEEIKVKELEINKKAEGRISEIRKKLKEAESEREKELSVKAKTLEEKEKLESKLRESKDKISQLQQAISEAEKVKDLEMKELAKRSASKIADIEASAVQKIKDNQKDVERVRLELISIIAKKIGYVDVVKATTLVPNNVYIAEEIKDYLVRGATLDPSLTSEVSVNTFCSPGFRGKPLNLELTADDTFDELLQELRNIYGINFLPDAEILSLPVRVNVQGVPWNVVLQSQLNYLDLQARCTEGNTIAILKRSKMNTLDKAQKDTIPLTTEFIKLKHLRPPVGGANASNDKGGTKFTELEKELDNILKEEGFTRGSITRVPGANEFFISTTQARLEKMKSVIARTDTPQYQVVLSASILTLNENKIKDVGGQLSLVAGNGSQSILGGLLGIPSSGSGGSQTSTTDDGSGSSSTQGNSTFLNPGGVPNLGTGFNSPNGGSNLGISAIFGTTQFSAQINLLKTQGVVKVDNRPLIVIPDGATGRLEVGRNVYVPIQASALSGGTGQVEVINAGSSLTATPQVIFDENGLPIAVNLNLEIESNDVDTTVVSSGIPSVIKRSLDTSIRLNANETGVVGGFTTSSKTNSETKTPFFGDLPLIGNIFRRTVKSDNEDKLYFSFRVELIADGQVIRTIPVNVNTIPTSPDPNNDFFKPYNEVKKTDLIDKQNNPDKK